MWILQDALNQYLEVKVCACGSACGTHFSNLLPALNQVPFFDQYLGRMGVTGDEVVAVVNFNHVAVGLVVFLSNDDATRSSNYRSALLGREIQHGMQR